MGRPSCSMVLAKKAESILIAAIEIYNKPHFLYREETFTILMVNAWELLLKAHWLALHKNALDSIHVRERGAGAKSRIRRNRSGNALTVGLSKLIAKLDGLAEGRLPANVKQNIEALVEVRDNAVHLRNVAPLAQRICGLGTASVQNFVKLLNDWFGRDLSQYKLYLMPIAFLPPAQESKALVRKGAERKLLDYLRPMLEATVDPDGFNVALRIDLRITKASTDGENVVITNDPTATPVRLEEDNVRDLYQWDHGELVHQLKQRYSDFKVDKAFHALKRSLSNRREYVVQRQLDPGKPSSGSKSFYSRRILQEFDKHYSKQARAVS